MGQFGTDYGSLEQFERVLIVWNSLLVLRQFGIVWECSGQFGTVCGTSELLEQFKKFGIVLDYMAQFRSVWASLKQCGLV